MSKLILPSDTIEKNHHDVVFVNTPPGQEDSELAEIIKNILRQKNLCRN